MALVLSFSSQVVAGHIGHNASVFALETLGHTVWQVPTCLLAYPPDLGRPAAETFSPETLDTLVASLDDKGWLSSVDAIFSGYLAAADQANGVETALERVRRANPAALFACDPIMGDEPGGFYVGEEIATAQCRLAARADILFPNRFEYEVLSGQNSLPASPPATLLITSAQEPAAYQKAAPICRNRLIFKGEARTYETPLLDGVPHGTGDLLAGLTLGRILNGEPADQAATTAIGSVFEIARASQGETFLSLIANREALRSPARLPERKDT